MRKTGQSAPALAARMDNPDLPFKDKKVMLALNMGWDKPTMGSDYYKGNAELYSYPFINDAAHQTVYTPFDQLSELARSTFEYHPDRAKELLAEAGYPNGFKTKVDASNLGDNIDVLSIIKEDWVKIGVELEIVPHEASVQTSISRGRQHEAMILGGSQENFTTVKLLSVREESADDRSFYERPETRAAYNEIIKNVGKNDAAADKILKEITPFLLEDPWGVWLPMPYTYDVWWPWLKDYEGQWNFGDWNPNCYSRYVWIDQALKTQIGY